MKQLGTIVALLADTTGEQCPLCDSDSVMEVCTKVSLDVRTKAPARVPATIPDYLYYVCENPECNFEFVNSAQAKRNERHIIYTGKHR